MRIAFFTDTYLPNIDGVVSAIVSFKEELEKKGNKVFVYSSGEPTDSTKEVMMFKSIPFPPYPQYKIALFPFSAKKEVKKNNIQLIHCHALASMGLAAIKTADDLKLPLIGTFHTMAPLATQYVTRRKITRKIVSKIAWKLIKNFYKPFDLVTVPSNCIKKVLEEEGLKNEIKVVPNGLNLNRFNPRLSPSPMKTILGIPKEEKIVLVIGRMSEEKNVEVIIKAADLVNKEVKTRFLIAGDGPARKKYEKIAEKSSNPNSFLFTGFVSKYELPYLYSCCDLMATASTFETQGLTILEAMACGKPVVGANALAIPEAIKDGENGFLFTPFKEEECAEKIIRILRMNEKERKKMSQKARKTAELYSIEKCTNKLLETYNSLV